MSHDFPKTYHAYILNKYYFISQKLKAAYFVISKRYQEILIKVPVNVYYECHLEVSLGISRSTYRRIYRIIKFSLFVMVQFIMESLL